MGCNLYFVTIHNMSAVNKAACHCHVVTNTTVETNENLIAGSLLLLCPCYFFRICLTLLPLKCHQQVLQ